MTTTGIFIALCTAGVLFMARVFVALCNEGRRQPWHVIHTRLWFHKDLYALTLGGGAIDNPGRCLVLISPINGATAASGTPYFTTNPGDPYKAPSSLTAGWTPDLRKRENRVNFAVRVKF